MRRFYLTLIVVFTTFLLRGDILDDYVQIGLNNNLALQQENFSLKKSVMALREARGMFLPTLSLEARYSRAGGGRLIEMPIGDLVNPVYQTLNQLLMVHGLPAGFPEGVDNQVFPFLREEEHDTKIRIIQPLFQPAIFFNYKIKGNLNKMQRAKVRAFKRQLIADIKSAYYSYLKALEVRKILAEAKALVEENCTLSQSLVDNHVRTMDTVYQARGEMSKLKSEIAEAEKHITLARGYFNFLLNRSLDSPIQIPEEKGYQVSPPEDLKLLTHRALETRDEFRQLDQAMQAARHHLKLNKSKFLPTATAVIDYGFQGEQYRFTKEDDYWMASIVVSWNLFKGGRDRAAIAQSVLEVKRFQAQQEELVQKIRLQVREAHQDALVALRKLQAARDQLRSNESAFKIIAKKYKEGMALQIEYINARNQFTISKINTTISRYDALIKGAVLERVSASRPVN